MTNEPLDLDRVQRFFNDQDEYTLASSHVDRPGKDLITVHDHEQGTAKTLTWEGDNQYGIVTGDSDRVEPLDEDTPLYSVAEDVLTLYEYGTIVQDDGRARAGTATLSKSGGESGYALNNPLEWGVENDARDWSEREPQGLIGSVKDLLD